MLWYAVLLTLVVGPLLLALRGTQLARRETPAVLPPWRWRLSAASMLFYVLAFNLTFFIQELFLVVPKALTPGLRATLFHNNHRWDGDHPLAALFQGSGALATLLFGIFCAVLSRRARWRSTNTQLFVLWLAYCGIFMALPQVVIGALSGASDVGMAMDYFALSQLQKNAAALLALAAIPLAALYLAPSLLRVAASAADIAGRRGRFRFVFLAGLLPALLAIVLIVPFRIPREAIEVVLLPLLVTVCGLAWMQAGAWRSTSGADGDGRTPLLWPVIALAVLLLVFQGHLRHGVVF